MDFESNLNLNRMLSGMDGRGQENTLNLKGNDEDKLGSALALHYYVASAKNKSGFMLEETNFSGKIFFCFQFISNLLVKKIHIISRNTIK